MLFLPSLLAQVVEVRSLGSSQVLGWGTLALINAGLAQTKGKSALFWWALSLFLGPVATFLLVAFVEPSPPTHSWSTSPPPASGSPYDKPPPLDF